MFSLDCFFFIYTGRIDTLSIEKLSHILSNKGGLFKKPNSIFSIPITIPRSFDRFIDRLWVGPSGFIHTVLKYVALPEQNTAVVRLSLSEIFYLSPFLQM